MISAEIVADSVHKTTNKRIVSVLVTLPRIVLAELNTHRMFSRNSASSRAIPAAKMIENVRTNPFIPIKFQKGHKGMQGTEYHEGDAELHLIHRWEILALNAAAQAEGLLKADLTKQLVNRTMEPYMWHTVLITATEWDNFFNLRLNKAAEIHINEAALCIHEAMSESSPKEIQPGEWHIPFGDRFEEDRLLDIASDLLGGCDTTFEEHEDDCRRMFPELKAKISIARCARLSYLNYEGKDDYEADLALYEQLMKMGHWSPFEHVARAMTDKERAMYTKSFPSKDGIHAITSFGWSRNFQDFVQYRQLVDSQDV